MKKLTIIRHADTLPADPGQRDYDRALSNGGIQEAKEQAKKIWGIIPEPDRIVSSGALRAFTTAVILAEGAGIGEDRIEMDNLVYENTAGTLLDVITASGNVFEHVMVVGHIPGLVELAHYLSPGCIDGLRTCCGVHFELGVDSWEDVGAGGGKVVAELKA